MMKQNMGRPELPQRRTQGRAQPSGEAPVTPSFTAESARPAAGRGTQAAAYPARSVRQPAGTARPVRQSSQPAGRAATGKALRNEAPALSGGSRKPRWPRFLSGERKRKQDAFPDSMELAVLEDVDNGNEYYMALVDRFQVAGRMYVAMNAYEPDDGSHRAPEFVIMRCASGANGAYFYQSIRSRKELNMAFNAFFERYVEHL